MRYIVLSLLLLFALATPATADDAATTKKPDSVAVLAWASGTVTQTLTFGFADYRDVFDKAQKNFTPEGWKSFQDSQQRSGLIKNVVEYQEVATSWQALPKPPVIDSEGPKDGGYQWTVTVPVVQKIHAGNKTATRIVNVTVALIENPSRLGEMYSTMTIVRWSEPL